MMSANLVSWMYFFFNVLTQIGSLVVRFKSLVCFKRALSCLKTAQIEGKTVFLKVLPELKVSICVFGVDSNSV